VEDTGGNAPNPTYESVCAGDGHTEAVRLIFDPEAISYEELMRAVLGEANTHMTKAQYQSAVWANSSEQAEVAARVAAATHKSSVPILSASDTAWFDAEEYHRA
jgi:peptide-methionine (S)-S-oxide reductase